MGYLLLQGGEEFTGQMRRSDMKALALVGGMDAQIRIVPAAAAADNNHRQAGQNGEQWFRALGATRIKVVPLIDEDSANAPQIAADLQEAQLVYLLGGFPGYLARCLAGSLAWEAVQRALGQGAVLAGSSAGAMVMCEHFYDPVARCVVSGLGLIDNSCALPHHDTFGAQWAGILLGRLPEVTLIGIDAQTGMLGDIAQTNWTVYGRGAVSIYQNDHKTVYADGDVFSL